MPKGNPPKPTELKRRLGNPGRRPLPDINKIVALPAAVGVPDPPNRLEADGLSLWRNVWTAGAIWISPATDIRFVVEACRAADDVAQARRRYQASNDVNDLRGVVAASKMLTEALSALGFSPTARARLGVAEVVTQSKLEQLRHSAAQRGS